MLLNEVRLIDKFRGEQQIVELLQKDIVTKDHRNRRLRRWISAIGRNFRQQVVTSSTCPPTYEA